LIAIPEFIVGSLLIVIFAGWVDLFPPVSLIDSSRTLGSQPSILVLPVATLLAASVAQTVRMIRATMIDVLKSDYVQMARLKGLPERKVLTRHALPNALAPTIQIMALNVAWLVGGVIVVETLFSYRGIGLALTEAVSVRDLPTVRAIVMLIAVVYVGTNLLADAAVILLNPRLRRSV
jgi:peptide/nickel transport system permease protein